jgi:Ca-activated chloride channel homolog
MNLIWPGALLLLVILPVIIAVYLWILRRHRRFAVRYSSLALVRDVIPRTARLRRHLPFGLLLLGLLSLVVALSRPTAAVAVPSGQATIMLALDVSRSMCSMDIPPNRLQAAKAAVLSFIDRQDDHAQIGIVAFAGFAALVQPPTSDQDVLRSAVQNLTTGRRTAIGGGILESLRAIDEVNGISASVPGEPGSENPNFPRMMDGYTPDIIVVLSDGASNTGIHPLDAAQLAVERGVRVYTIGYGSHAGAAMDCGDGFQGRFTGGGSFTGGGFGGGFRRGIDEETLMAVAEMTGGEYYSASSAGELHNVFRQLPTYLMTVEEDAELSVAFTALGALLTTLAMLLSLVWHPFP